MKDIYVALDIGSASIKIVVAEMLSSNLHVLFAKKNDSSGVKFGLIEDANAVERDVRSLILEAEEALETKIHSVAITIPSTGANIYQGNGKVDFEGSEFISVDNLICCIKESSKLTLDKNEDIVSVIPVKYIHDKKSSFEAPIGVKAKSLSVESMLLSSKKKVLYPFIKTIENLNVHALEMCNDAFSSAKEVFDVVYLQEGAILVDVGFKKTTISYFKDGYMQSLMNCGMGGYSFTKRIAQEFHITMNQAENYKVKYGSLVARSGQDDIIHTTHLNESQKDYTQNDLTEILKDESIKLMEEIKVMLDAIDDVAKKEIVLIGGGSNLVVLKEVAGQVLKSPIRTYKPNNIGARDVCYIPCLGLIYYIMEKSKLAGKYPSSLVLPDITSTMSFRFKGLTKTEKPKASKLSLAMDKLLGEE